jgi:hypothetical protein
MAFQISLSNCQNNNCKSLVLVDNSADTSVTPNLTWGGSGMPLIQNVSDASILITASSNTSVSFQFDVTPFFKYPYLGRISASNGGTIITGTNTTFTTSVTVGDVIGYEGSSYSYQVSSITSDTQLVVTTSILQDINNKWGFNNSLVLHNASNLIYTIISDDLGMALNVSIPDDIYNIIYTLTDSLSGTVYSYETNLLLYCNTECCVYNKIATIPQFYSCSTCNSTHIDEAMLAYSMMIGLRANSSCGNSTAALNTLNLLKKICNYQPCVGCK